jgi:hypothetical protein
MVSSNGGAGKHTSNSNHSKTSVEVAQGLGQRLSVVAFIVTSTEQDLPVLQFRQLHLVLLRCVDWVKTKRIKRIVTWATVELVHVGISWESASLHERDPSKDLDHGLRKGIVSIDNLRDGLERELFTRDADEFRDNETSARQHSGTAVLQLGFTEPWEPVRSTLQY